MTRRKGAGLFAQLDDECVDYRVPMVAGMVRRDPNYIIGALYRLFRYSRTVSGTLGGGDPVAIVEGVAQWNGKRGLLVQALLSVHILELLSDGALFVVGSERYWQERDRKAANQRDHRTREKAAVVTAPSTTPYEYGGWGGGVDANPRDASASQPMSPVTAPTTTKTEDFRSSSSSSGELKPAAPSGPQPPDRQLALTWLKMQRDVAQLPRPQLEEAAYDTQGDPERMAKLTEHFAQLQLLDEAPRCLQGMLLLGRAEDGRILLGCRDDEHADWARDRGTPLIQPVLQAHGFTGAGFYVAPDRSALREVHTLEHWVALAMLVRDALGLPPCAWEHEDLDAWWQWASERYGGQAAILAYTAWCRDPGFKGTRQLRHWLSRDAKTGDWKVCTSRLDDAKAWLLAA